MTGLSRGANMAIARSFPVERYKTFVDVGTAQGDLAVQMALANPHLRGIGFDLPEVAPIFEEYIAALGVADRVRSSPGELLQATTLPKADVVMMGHILHDWDLPTKQMLIGRPTTRCRPAARSSSTRRSSTTIGRRTRSG